MHFLHLGSPYQEMQFSRYQKRDHEPSLLQFLPAKNNIFNIHQIFNMVNSSTNQLRLYYLNHIIEINSSLEHQAAKDETSDI